MLTKGKFIIVILVYISIESYGQTPVTDKADTAWKKIDKVFTFVQYMPQFPGGNDSLKSFLKKNLHYPYEARIHGIEGWVNLSCIIDTSGTLYDITLLRDIGGGCGKEAIRLARLMPKWIPGKQNGKAVDVCYNLPIQFQLYP